MLINNPLEMNDWNYGRFIKTVIIIQILMLICAFLSVEGIVIPILSSLVGFIYLTFIPGYLLLRIFKQHKIGCVKSLIYGVGLSLSSLMFVGYALNMCLPFLGVNTPISVIPVAAAYTLLVVVLSLLSYVRDRNFSSPNLIDTDQLFNPIFLFLCLIPFIAIFGSYTMYLYSNNLISMFLLIIIAAIPILIVNKKIPEKFYLFTIWIVSISLLYSSTLIASLVWGWDIQNEYYLANLVLNYSTWNFSLPDAYNAMLSIVIVGPIYSLLTSVDLDHVFKLFYPFIFSLMPLGLYRIFHSQTNSSRIAFLSVFLFVSFNTFYIELVTLSREMVAELFMVIIIMLLLERKVKPAILALITIFSVSLVVSHYSVTYFFILSILGVTIIMAINNLSKFGISKETLGLGSPNNLIMLIYVTVITALAAFLWYGSYAGGLALKSISDVANVVLLNISQILDVYIGKVGLAQVLPVYTVIAVIIIVALLVLIYLFVSVERRLEFGYESGVNRLNELIDYRVIAVISVVVLLLLTLTTGPFKTWIVSILRYLNFVAVFFTMMGIFTVLTQSYRKNFQLKYVAFTFVAIIMLVAGFLLPSFRAAFNITRIYELTFLILAPFCVYGGIRVLGSLIQIFSRHELSRSTPLKIFTIFLTIFLLFNTGFVSVLTETSVPMTLSNGNISSDYYPLFNIEEASSAQWLSQNKISPNIYADVYGRFIFNRYIFSNNEIAINNGVTDFTSYNPNNSYIYQRKLDINNSYLTGFTGMDNRNRVYLNMSVIVNPKNTVFDDGDSRIYYS